MDKSSEGHITFTVEPKTRRHVKSFPSGNRCKAFMRSLWNKGLRKTCSYNTLRLEFEVCFQTNDRRTVERYIGRPETVERTSGLSEVQRQNRNTGKTAFFRYNNKLRLTRKIGLLERLGYTTFFKKGAEWRCLLHHEIMPYFTEQVSLEDSVPPAPPLLNVNECVVVSKDEMCVSPLYDKSMSGNGMVRDGEKDVVGAPQNKNNDNNNVIESTHTNLQHSGYASRHTKYALTLEEKRILQSAKKTEP